MQTDFGPDEAGKALKAVNIGGFHDCIVQRRTFKDNMIILMKSQYNVRIGYDIDRNAL